VTAGQHDVPGLDVTMRNVVVCDGERFGDFARDLQRVRRPQLWLAVDRSRRIHPQRKGMT